jgi:formylmethanofuran dehydrogenase subunit C
MGGVRLAALGLCLAIFGGSHARGQTTYTWTGNGTDSNWNTAANWSDGVPVSSNATILVFDGSTRTTPDNNLGNWNLSVGRLEFASGAAAFTLQGNNFGFEPYLGSGEQQIFQNSANTQTISVSEFAFRPGSDSRINLNAGDLEVTSTLSLEAHDTDPRQLTITGNTTDRHTLVLSGALAVTGNSTYPSPSIVITQNKRFLVEGTLNLRDDSFVGVYDGVLELSGSGSITSNAYLELGTLDGSFNSAIWLSTDGVELNQDIDVYTAPDSRATIGGLNTSGTVTYAGPIYVNEVSGAVDLAAATGGTVDFSGDLEFSSAPVSVNRPDGETTYGGTVVFSGSTLGSGGTTVEAGTLLVEGSVNGSVSIESAAALGGDGSVTGSVSFLAGADFVFDPLTTLTVDSGSVTFGGFSIADIIGLSSSTPENTYTLIGGNATFDFDNVSNVGYANRASLGDGKFAYFQSGSLQLVVVPEPGTLLLGGVAVAISLLYARRARRRHLNTAGSREV